jgi:hypothetical protein
MQFVTVFKTKQSPQINNCTQCELDSTFDLSEIDANIFLDVFIVLFVHRGALMKIRKKI